MNLANLDTLISFAVVMLLLSLIITTVVQMASWGLKFRENVLHWGVMRIIQQIAPEVDAELLANRILTHPSLNPTKFRGATAIKFDELVKILKDLLANQPEYKGQPQYQALLGTLTTAPVSELTQLAAVLEDELKRAFPKEADFLVDAAERAKKKALEAGTRVRFWFDTVMDRSTERFSAYTRWATVVAAVLLAFGGRVDSLDIVKQLSERHDVRARLVQMADPLLKQASTIVGPAPTASTAEDSPLSAALVTLRGRYPEIPRGFTPPQSGDSAAWEAALTTAVPPEIGERLLADFRTEVGKQELKKLTGQFVSLKGDLDRSGLRIIPEHPYAAGYLKHFLGMLLSAIFLSLGAPFWFNALRQLSSLRPILAGRVDAKENQDDRG